MDYSSAHAFLLASGWNTCNGAIDNGDSVTFRVGPFDTLEARKDAILALKIRDCPGTFTANRPFDLEVS
ncbi:hypothetical protein OAL66_01800 [bacterium]|nr:hypothetical protein [bacterium]